MATTFVRTVVIYIIVLIAVRLMGKREIGQLQPFELGVIIIIADVASVPMENINIPLIQGIIPIMGLLFGQLVFSYLDIKVPGFHKLFTGKPTMLIEKGKILEESLKKQRYPVEELLEQLRVAGYPNIMDVDYAILETSGEVSIIPKKEKNSVTIGDLNLETDYEGYPRIVVLEGTIIESNLLKLNKDEKWLNDKIKEIKIKLDKILVMVVDESGKVYFQRKKG